MKRVGSAVLAVVLALPGHILPAFSEQTAHIAGTVIDIQGNPVEGAEVVAQDSTGKVIARAVTSNRGEYALEGLAPGQYNLTANPLTTGFKKQTVVAPLGAEGLTINWAVSSATPAIAAATPGARPSVGLLKSNEAAAMGVLGVLGTAGVVLGALALSERGPRGRRGLTGATGARGPAGPAGAPGSPSK